MGRLHICFGEPQNNNSCKINKSSALSPVPLLWLEDTLRRTLLQLRLQPSHLLMSNNNTLQTMTR